MLSRTAYCGRISGYVNFKERHLWRPRDHSDRDNEETHDDDHQNPTTFPSPRNDRPGAAVAQSEQGSFQVTRAQHGYPRVAVFLSPLAAVWNPYCWLLEKRFVLAETSLSPQD